MAMFAVVGSQGGANPLTAGMWPRQKQTLLDAYAGLKTALAGNVNHRES